MTVTVRCPLCGHIWEGVVPNAGALDARHVRESIVRTVGQCGCGGRDWMLVAIYDNIPTGALGAHFDGVGQIAVSDEFEHRNATTSSVPTDVEIANYRRHLVQQGQLRRGTASSQYVYLRGPNSQEEWLDPGYTIAALAELLNLQPQDVEVRITRDPHDATVTIRAYVLRVHAVEAQISEVAIRFDRGDGVAVWRETVIQMARQLQDLVRPTVRLVPRTNSGLASYTITATISSGTPDQKPEPAPRRALDLREDGE